MRLTYKTYAVSTHSRPKAAAQVWRALLQWQAMFQHTAARRRLPYGKATNTIYTDGFNTQPPEGGCQALA